MKTPEQIALDAKTCKRCEFGIDDNDDGDCAVCHSWPVSAIQRVAVLKAELAQAKPFLQHHRLLLCQLRGYDKEVAELDELLEGLTHHH